MRFPSVSVALLLLASACGSKPTSPSKPAPGAHATLYDRIGGAPALTTVVDKLLARTGSDPRILDRFFNIDAVAVRQHLIEFLCVAMAGPCKYSGRDMPSTHATMELVHDEFAALVEDLVAVLDEQHVPAKEKGEILALLAPLEPQIVTPADKLHPLDPAKLAAVSRLAATADAGPLKTLLERAVVAGARGQRVYAEQLFTRAELDASPEMLASLAPTFREGAPPRVTGKLVDLPDTAPQPAVVGAPDEDGKPAAAPAGKRGALQGTLTVGGAAPGGLGVVQLYPPGGAKKRAPKHRIVEQRGRQFAPHLLAVPVGSTVAFPNYDPVFHNVFSRSETQAFDLGMYKAGEAREVVFKKPGIVRLGCNLHASMSAYVAVLDGAYWQIVQPDGHIALQDLPAGTYKFAAWSERATAPLEGTITIKPEANHVTWDLAAAPAGAAPGKLGQPR